MWAEEASTHLQNSFGSSIWEILFFIPNNEGYICLNRNLTTLITRLFDISFAATITTYTAFLVQLLPHCIILVSNQSFWGKRIQRVLLCSAIILIPIGTGETWLNTTCSHYHFGVLAFIILLDFQEAICVKKNIAYTMLLCLGALSSPITCFLFPSFILAKYLGKKIVPNYILIPFSICCFIQLAVSLLNIIEKQGLGASRFVEFNILEFPSILINDVAIKSTVGNTGLNFSLIIVRALSKYLSIDHHYIYWIFFFVFTLGICLIIKNIKKGNDSIILIIFSFISVFVFTYFSVSSSSSLLDRNALVPGAIFLSLIFFLLNNLKRIQVITVASIYFVIAFYEYYNFDEIYYSDNWPAWSNEVEKWRVDKVYQPKVWPRKNEHWSFLSEEDWRVTIPPDTE